MPCSSIYIMDLPALRTVPFLYGYGLLRLRASLCWHTGMAFSNGQCGDTASERGSSYGIGQIWTSGRTGQGENIMPNAPNSLRGHKNKCVSKTHIDKHGGAVKLCATPPPHFQGLSVAECMPLGPI